MSMKVKIAALAAQGKMNISIPNDKLDDIAIPLIVQVLSAYMAEHNIIKALPATFMDHIGSDWLRTGKDCNGLVGTFPKRLAKYFKREFTHNLSAEIMGWIGDIARKHCPKQTDFSLDFTNKFNWKHGDFGDKNSCYWSTREAAKDRLEESGGYAMRFYKEDGAGYARCWLMPYEHHCVLFNAYPDSFSLIKMARILSVVTECNYYKDIALCNNGDTDGQMWINGGDGAYVGSPEHSVDSFDLEIETGITCKHCGNPTPEDDIHYTSEGLAYCSDCYAKMTCVCDGCDAVVRRDDTASTRSHVYCQSCADDLLVECYHCDNWTEREDAVMCEDEYYCPRCADRHLYTCDACDELHTSITATADGKYLCDDCLDKCDQCPECEEYFWNGIDDCLAPEEQLDEGNPDLRMYCSRCIKKIVAYNMIARDLRAFAEAQPPLDVLKPGTVTVNEEVEVCV